jgi:hypothetical protein
MNLLYDFVFASFSLSINDLAEDWFLFMATRIGGWQLYWKWGFTRIIQSAQWYLLFKPYSNFGLT